jgi:hypothetical protein
MMDKDLMKKAIDYLVDKRKAVTVGDKQAEFDECGVKFL